MKIIVTGGAGFIGSHIVDKLVELGHEVGIVDNLRSGKRENVNAKATLFEVDVTDKETLLKTFQDFSPEVVFHLAAQNEVPFSMEHPYEDQQMNIVGMMNLCDVSSQTGVKKIVYSNTGGAFYGEVEEQDLPIVEDQPVLKPTSFYGVSKSSAETYLKLYGYLNGLQWVSLRYANVYGPRQDGNKEAGIVAIFTYKLLHKEKPKINGDGSHTRDYIYVGDVVEANIAALNYDQNDYFNVATSVETTNLQVFQTIEEQLKTGMEVELGSNRPGDPLRSSLSAKKAKDKMGWEPKVTFKEGIKKTIEFYQEKP